MRRPYFCLENEYFGFRMEEKEWDIEKDGVQFSLSFYCLIWRRTLKLTCMMRTIWNSGAVFWIFFLNRRLFFGLVMEEKREKSGAEAEFPPEEPSLPLMGVVTSFKNFIIPMPFALHRKSIPHICHGRHGLRPCKFFLAGVNFYRFNAKNWQFTL